MPILDRFKECASRDTLEQLQLERLQAVANRVYRHVPFYRKYFEDAGITPGQIESLADLARLPLTDREVLVQNHPYGLFAVPLRDIVRLNIASTGPAGDIVVGYTANDIRCWNEMAARALSSAGITAEDVVQIAVSYDLYSGTTSLHHGAEMIGATVMPGSGLSVSDQLRLLEQYRVTALVATPSNALNLLEYVRENAIDPNNLFLRRMLLVGESISGRARKELADTLYVDVCESYGVAEIATPGIAYECEAKTGPHLSEDLFLVEILNPNTNAPLPVGEEGELVLTTLSKEGIPYIRYRTGDRTRLHLEPCRCGRTFARIDRVTQRTDDLVTVNGVRFFPHQIADLLQELGYGHLPYHIEISRSEHRDRLEIHLGVTSEVFDDEVKTIDTMRQTIEEKVSDWLRIPAAVRLMEGHHLENAPRVADQRML
jgi:phenylacetate-CoA ligase